MKMRRIAVYEVDTDNKPATAALTLLRVALGGILMVHGWQKLTDIPGTVASFTSLGIPGPEVCVYLAILGEFFGGLGLVLGALTPLAAVGAMFTMAGAIYFVHREHGLLSQHGGFEYPLVILLTALYFAAHGAGPVSVDALAARHRLRTKAHRREWRASHTRP
jgi:putative oxidoreductase